MSRGRTIPKTTPIDEESQHDTLGMSQRPDSLGLAVESRGTSFPQLRGTSELSCNTT